MNDLNESTVSPSISVIEEKLKVSKQVVEKAKIRITKKVEEENAIANLSLTQEEVQIVKIPINEYVETTPPVRYEGDNIIIPVVKEVMVVVKKLLLVEELHINKSVKIKEEQQIVTLKKEEVTIERIPVD